MRVAIVSTYAPKACGIAVFSGDLRTAMLAANRGSRIDVVAMLDETAPRPTGSEVLTTIARNDPGSYRAAAELLSDTDVDVVVIEHEFGLFGGPAGEAVLELADSLRQPLVITLHTVLSEPSDAQLSVLRRLCGRAVLTTVFTQTARRMIVAQGIASAERVRVVPHGAPDVLLSSAPTDEYVGRTVLSTFGLISAGKGIETAVAALPKIVARHPEVLYLIVGQTHPDVVRNDGESYRDDLARLVAELDLADHVRFVDRFADISEIAELLARTDLYLTPYRSREQIVSGALTFAVAAGCPVVSTPYFYAEDLLGSGAGVLVPFEDPDAMSSAVVDLLDDPRRLAAARVESRRIGSGLAWSQVAIDTFEVLREGYELDRPDYTNRMGAWPVPRLDHLFTLVDDVGIVEHATGAVPNRADGYCTDDAARLALVCSGLLKSALPGAVRPELRRMLTRALAFLPTRTTRRRARCTIGSATTAAGATNPTTEITSGAPSGPSASSWPRSRRRSSTMRRRGCWVTSPRDWPRRCPLGPSRTESSGSPYRRRPNCLPGTDGLLSVLAERLVGWYDERARTGMELVRGLSDLRQRPAPAGAAAGRSAH